jgi:hypothetical protein
MSQAALRSKEAFQSGPARPSQRRGRKLSSRARGAITQTVHGPLQRLLGAIGQFVQRTCTELLRAILGIP